MGQEATYSVHTFSSSSYDSMLVRPLLWCPFLGMGAGPLQVRTGVGHAGLAVACS